MSEFEMNRELQTHYGKYYDGLKSDWKRLSRQDTLDNITGLCAGITHRTVLEIGCGDGVLLELLSEVDGGFADDLYAIEVAQSAIDLTLERGIDSLRHCGLFDGYTIPYEEGRFDLAIMSHVIEHVEYPRRLIYEAARVARHVFAEVPLEDNMRLSDNFTFTRTGHINYYSRKTIRRLVQSCGYDLVAQVVTNPSSRVYRHNYGWKGTVKHLVKSGMLRTFPDVATALWTYHSALLYRKAEAAR